MGLISFTTDYGLDDGFVAACHAVVAGLAPDARIIDVTHLVPSGDVRRAAHILAQTVSSFPSGSVHLAVVDPGVGTARRPLAVETRDGSRLVGPDNGLLLPAAAALGGAILVVSLTDRSWWRAGDISDTFHGRDIFAPVAARLALGRRLADAGVEVTDPVSLPAPRCSASADGSVTTEVLMVDRFGNVQLAVRDFSDISDMSVNGGPVARAATTFGDAPVGALVLLKDSAGYLALAVNGGSAADRLRLNPGDEVVLAP